MSHEVETAVYANEPAWHRQGTVVRGVLSIEEAGRLGGFQWDPEAHPIYADIPTPDGVKRIEIPSNQVVIRNDTQEPLGVVGRDYRPMLHKEAFGFFQPLVDDKTVQLEAAGVLRKGKRVWILARFMDPMEVTKEDRLDPFLLFATGHDGTLSTWIKNTATRVVCINTMVAAMGGDTDEKVTERLVKEGAVCIRHMGDPTQRLEQARTAVLAARKGAKETVEVFRALRAVEIKDEKQATEWVREVFDPDYVAARKLVKRINDRLRSDELKEDQERRAALAEKRNELEALLDKPNWTSKQVLENFESAPGHELAGKTAYGLYSAATYYLTHQRSKDEGIGLEGNWFGQHAQMNRKALAHAVALLD